VVLVVRVKEKASVRGVGGGRSRDEVSGFVLLHNPEEVRFGRKTGVFVKKAGGEKTVKVLEDGRSNPKRKTAGVADIWLSADRMARLYKFCSLI
jgi:hypothetical protein